MKRDTPTLTPKRATEKERRELYAAGFFEWGRDTWIHERALGDLMTTREALARVRKR